MSNYLEAHTDADSPDDPIQADMSEQVGIELYPQQIGANVGACVQKCMFCPAAKNMADIEATRGYTPESLESLRLLQRYVAEHGKRLIAIVVAGGMHQFEEPQESIELSPAPETIAFEYGGVGNDIENVPAIHNRAVEKIEFILDGLPERAASELQFSIVPELDDEQNISNFPVIAAVISSLTMHLNDPKFVAKYGKVSFSVSLDSNNVDREPWTEAAVVEKGKSLFRSIATGLLPAISSEIGAKLVCEPVYVELNFTSINFILSVSNNESAQGNGQVFSHISLRMMINEPRDYPTPLDNQAHFALMPQEVWYKHHAAHLGDRSVRFSYKKFLEVVGGILKEGPSGNGKLVSKFNSLVEARRRMTADD